MAACCDTRRDLDAITRAPDLSADVEDAGSEDPPLALRQAQVRGVPKRTASGYGSCEDSEHQCEGFLTVTSVVIRRHVGSRHTRVNTSGVGVSFLAAVVVLMMVVARWFVHRLLSLSLSVSGSVVSRAHPLALC
jgi:hypothetical protein